LGDLPKVRLGRAKLLAVLRWSEPLVEACGGRVLHIDQVLLGGSLLRERALQA
jgi:hypothetical protein